MTVVVSFVSQSGLGGGATGLGRIIAQERITVPGTTSRAAQSGEIVIIGNGESSMVAAAYGTAPDAAATAENLPTTSAGFPIGPGQVAIPFSPGSGNKINIKAVT